MEQVALRILKDTREIYDEMAEETGHKRSDLMRTVLEAAAEQWKSRR